MRATFAKSPSETSTDLPSLRFTFGDLDERIWRVLVWPRLIFPVPVLLKRFFAPVWVFNLGIFFSFWTGASPSDWPRARHCPALATLRSVYQKPFFPATGEAAGWKTDWFQALTGAAATVGYLY